MAYTTKEKIRERLPLVTASVRNNDILDDFIGQGDAVIDSYLRSVYSLPLTSPLDSLVGYIALDFVCGLVLENVFGEDAPTSSGQSSILKQRAIKMLGQIRDGELLLEHSPLANATPAVSRPALDSTNESQFAVDDATLTLPEN